MLVQIVVFVSVVVPAHRGCRFVYVCVYVCVHVYVTVWLFVCVCESMSMWVVVFPVVVCVRA